MPGYDSISAAAFTTMFESRPGSSCDSTPLKTSFLEKNPKVALIFPCLLFVVIVLVRQTNHGVSFMGNKENLASLLGTTTQASEAIMATKFTPINAFPSVDDINNGVGMKWYCAPDSWQDTWKEDSVEGKGGWWKIEDGKLLLAPAAKKDFWRKTYYQPLLVKDDGSFLYATVPKDTLPVTIQTAFSLTPKAQFDQAGIIIRLDKEHWIKTGIEVVDGQPRLSCVVTNGFSDWSTQSWSVPAIRIRVHILPQNGGSFVVEAAPIGTEDWAFIRIAHMNGDFNHDLLNDDPAVQGAYEGESAPPGTLLVGVFAASPVAQDGMVATFDELSITQGSQFVHDA